MISRKDFDGLEFIPRASSFSKLMGKKGLGKTGETYISEYLSEKIKGCRKEFSSKYTEKGTTQENESIALVNRVSGTNNVKNEKHFTHAYCTGTPDILPDKEVIDIKTNWDFFTFDAVDNTPEINPVYYYQLMAYMMITGRMKAKLKYCLVDTPEKLIESEITHLKWKENAGEDLSPLQIANVISKHTYDDLPDAARVIDFEVSYDEDVVELMHKRVDEARVIFNNLKERKAKRYFNQK